MSFPERMMPGESPYTDNERLIRDALISDAALAEELFSIDDLDTGEELYHEPDHENR